MKRAFVMFALFSFFPLAFLPGDVSGGGPCSNSITPPFIASGVKPNILIILDNSNSMDEDFYGNAVGSYSSVSKAVVARQALQNVVTNLQSIANVGVMTYTLPNDISSTNLFNSLPFASYNPNSYCPNAPADCVTYCTTGNATSKANCEAACPGLTTTTYATGTNFPDAILNTANYPFNEPTGTRARYCGLIYPKTQMWQANSSSSIAYWTQADAMYDTAQLFGTGTWFGYCGSDNGLGSSYSYSYQENATNKYMYRTTKTGTTDDYENYGGSSKSCSFQPTDSDWALGFYNFGQRFPVYYVGSTWISTTDVNAPQGYLNVPIGALSNSTQYNNVYNILNPNLNNSANYMSCNAGNMNTCSYIVNAGNTPTAGTLNTAFNYFNGTLAGQTSPITSACQKNYIIYATDGLPSTLMNGNPTSNISQLMTEVITQLGNLQTGVKQTFGGKQYTFPVNTYVLGMGLTSSAQANLNQMAVAGATATASGQAYYGNSPTQFVDALDAIITDLLGRAAAGSSISILSEGQSQNGDNMLQGIFYPTRLLGGSTISWPGYLYNYWFYNGTTNSSGVSYNNIREDTVHDYILELNEDDALQFVFDQQLGLSVNRYSDSNDALNLGNADTLVDNIGLDSLTPLWEAGKVLFQTTPAGRTIYTPGTSATGLVSFNTSNTTLTTAATSPLGNPSATPSTLDPCLQGSTGTATLQNLINYVSGTDLTGCRNRTFGLCSNGTAFSNTPCGSNSDCTTSPYSTCTKNVWKLGDIVYSTPQVQTDYKYCSNGASFNTVLCSKDSDCSSSGAYNSCQKKQSITFVGANDGMLHAFQTGTMSTAGLNASQYQITELTGITTPSYTSSPQDMGQELWAFIPKNSLPYLRCLAVPPPSSCHLYYNDLAPYITTMVSNGVSKTVLIGGMRLGGAAISTATPTSYCFNSSGATNGQVCSSVSSCTSWQYKSSCSGECLNSSGVSNGQKCSSVTNCTTSPYNAGCSNGNNYYISAPSDTCSSMGSTAAALCSNTATCYNPTNCTGLSSYYALDITDAQNPILLWEFSHPFLGYTYSGPAVIHRPTSGNPNAVPPTAASGDQYFVMFLSGPTNQSDGSSIQDVQAFVLTLNANLGISSLYYQDLGGNTANGFGGRLFTNGLDVNGDGYTDYVFFGYGNSAGGTSTGWTGGIGKVFTGTSNAATWTYDITTYGNIATLPITAKITAEQCFKNWYLYAGTGRYFFPQDNYGGAGNGGLNYIMGIPFTCDQFNKCGLCISSGLCLSSGSCTSSGSCFNSAGATNGMGCSTVSDCAAPYNSTCSSPGVTNGTGCSSTSDCTAPYKSSCSTSGDSNGQTCSRSSDCTAPYNSSCSSAGTSNGQTCSQNSDCATAPYNSSCSSAISDQNSNACTYAQGGNLDQAGWQYTLDPAETAGGYSYLAERLVTDPTISPGNNTIYLTTSEPTSDPCGYGGRSRVWGMNCATGAAMTDQSCSGHAVSNLLGTMYLQTSTGAICQINSGTFSDTTTGKRTTPWYIGMPPENAPPVVQPPTTSTTKGGQLIQWIEK